MADHDRIDLAGVQTLAFHRRQGGGAAVDERGVALHLQTDAGLEATTAAERVPAADEPDLHAATVAPSGVC